MQVWWKWNHSIALAFIDYIFVIATLQDRFADDLGSALTHTYIHIHTLHVHAWMDGCMIKL